MSDSNLPKGWTATAWEVRYGDVRIRVSREWTQRNGMVPRKLIVSWDVAITSAEHKTYRAFDGVTDGDFESIGDLASDLATATFRAKKALTTGAAAWTDLAKEMP